MLRRFIMMDHSRLDMASQPRLQSLSTYIYTGQKIQNLRGKTQNSKAVLFLRDPGNEVDLRRAKNLPKLIGKKRSLYTKYQMPSPGWRHPIFRPKWSKFISFFRSKTFKNHTLGRHITIWPMSTPGCMQISVLKYKNPVVFSPLTCLFVPTPYLFI